MKRMQALKVKHAR